MSHFIVIKAGYLAELVAAGTLTFSEAVDTLMADAVRAGWCDGYRQGLRTEWRLMDALAKALEQGP